MLRTLKSRTEFERTFRQGRRLNHPVLRMVICDAKDEGDPGRVAFVAAKRLGNAVFRNRSKRVLRVAARSCGLPTAGKDVILFATVRTATSTPAEMVEGLSQLMRRAGIDG